MLTKLRNDSASRTLRFYQDTERNCRERKWFQYSREWSEGRCNCRLITSHMTHAKVQPCGFPVDCLFLFEPHRQCQASYP